MIEQQRQWHVVGMSAETEVETAIRVEKEYQPIRSLRINLIYRI